MSATVTAKNSFAGAEVAALLPVHIGVHDSVDLNLIHLFGVNGLGSAPFQTLQSLPLVGMDSTKPSLGDFAAGVVLADSDFCLHRGVFKTSCSLSLLPQTPTEPNQARPLVLDAATPSSSGDLLEIRK